MTIDLSEIYPDNKYGLHSTVDPDCAGPIETIRFVPEVVRVAGLDHDRLCRRHLADQR